MQFAQNVVFFTRKMLKCMPSVALVFLKSVGVHFYTFLVFLVDKLHGLTVGKCRIKQSLQQVSAIPRHGAH
jgi:hypothetical protein